MGGAIPTVAVSSDFRFFELFDFFSGWSVSSVAEGLGYVN
jgi:hypothetical protein